MDESEAVKGRGDGRHGRGGGINGSGRPWSVAHQLEWPDDGVCERDPASSIPKAAQHLVTVLPLLALLRWCYWPDR